MAGYAGLLLRPGFAAVSGVQHDAGPAAYPADCGRNKGYGAKVVFNAAFLKLPGLAAVCGVDNHRVEADYPDMLRVNAVNGKQVVGGNDGKGRLLGRWRLDPAA